MENKRTVVLKQTVLGDGVPKICIPVTGVTEREILEQARAAAAEKPDLLEWRADFYEKTGEREAAEKVLTAVSDICGQIPILFTFRSAAEGGNRAISTEAYRELNLWAAERPETDMIDVEGCMDGLDAGSLVAAVQKAGKPVAASCHFFSRTPDRAEMLSVLEELERTGADILKLAVMPSCPGDVLALLEVTAEMDGRTERPLITMSMGRLGAVSRVSGRLTGSALTFGTAGAASAPGQLPAAELRRMLELL